MVNLRTFITHISAFSVIATQVLCGCVNASDTLPRAADVPSVLAVSASHHETSSAERPPCHGHENSTRLGQADSVDVHDCEHCSTSLHMAGPSKAPVLIGTSTVELPDLSVAPVIGLASVIPGVHFADSWPPADEVALRADTLVSLKLLLLI